jgi:hypothetical protein
VTKPPLREREHLPLRPLWICRICAAAWPCAPARLSLWHEYAHDRVSLAIYLSGLLHEAAGDLYRLTPNPGPDPAELFARFLGWARRGAPGSV